MQIDRRSFTKGAIALAASAPIAGRAAAQLSPALSPQDRAMGAIEDYAEAHRRWFGLPGMTIGVSSPGGFTSVVNRGFSNLDAGTPITADTLFQIGSISKSFTAALLHQFASEGRLKLSDRITAVLPDAPLPRSSPIEVQHLLDHVAGIPGDAPLFVRGGLWTAYRPGKHWLYSNTGYDLLGRLAEHVGREPFGQLLAKRLYQPLGMVRTKGAITAYDRLLYAQGYEPADRSIPFIRGEALRPSAWVDTVSAAGSTASTAADMIAYLREIAGAAQGRGGLGLGAKAALAYASHSVPTDSEEMAYGNGLMHVGDKGRRYLHHTGGMVSFSSSFHVDKASGIGAFASSNIGYYPEYRPRKITLFAVQALASAKAGQPLPDPPPLESAVERPNDYAGRYAGRSRSFEIRSGPRLTLVSGGRQAALELADDDLFVTSHPDFRDFTVKFERTAGKVLTAFWGPETFVRDGANISMVPDDPALDPFIGRYVNDSPWMGTIVIVRRGRDLWVGTEKPLTPIGKNLWRVGEERWSPERASFANFMNGKPQTFLFSGVEFARQDV